MPDHVRLPEPRRTQLRTFCNYLLTLYGPLRWAQIAMGGCASWADHWEERRAAPRFRGARLTGVALWKPIDKGEPA